MRKLQEINQKHLGKNKYQQRKMVEFYMEQAHLALDEKKSNFRRGIRNLNKSKPVMQTIEDNIRASVEAQMKEIGGN